MLKAIDAREVEPILLKRSGIKPDSPEEMIAEPDKPDKKDAEGTPKPGKGDKKTTKDEAPRKGDTKGS
jgi:hypothetical protein